MLSRWTRVINVILVATSALGAPCVVRAGEMLLSLESGFREAQGRSIDERLVLWTGALLGRKRLVRDLVAAGHAPPSIQDRAPLATDRFDCTTYVETAAALARSRVPEDFFRRLVEIRYRRGEATFVARNHFTELDWIPNNRAAGVLRDVTREIAMSGGGGTAEIRKRIDRGAWLRGRARREGVKLLTNVEPSLLAARDAVLEVLTLDTAIRLLERIPEGVILNVVRVPRPDRALVVTHQGVVVRRAGKLVLRHARTGGSMRESDLAAYLRWLRRWDGWKVAGVNLLRLESPNESSGGDHRADESPAR